MSLFRILCGLLVLLLNSNAAEPVNIRTIAQGNFSGVQTPTQLVVTNSSQWEKLWKEHSAQRTPAAPAPDINFEKESILFVTAGQKRSGGHRLEIAAVKQADGEAEVLVKTRGPKPGGIQIQALTAPFHFVAVPRMQGTVKFKVEEAASAPR